MALAMNNNIVVDDIERVRELKAPVVYLLEGHDNDRIVIKRESAQESLVKSAKSIVKAIDPQAAKIKILKPSELAAVKQFVANSEADAQAYELMEVGYLINQDDRKGVGGLKWALGTDLGGVGWLKMDVLSVVESATAWESRVGTEGAPDKTDLRSFTKMLNAQGGLEKLGQLLVVDLFNDNRDRFRPEEKSQLCCITSLRFRCLRGPQNVFRIRTDGVDTVGSLDFIPNHVTSFTDINIGLKECETKAGLPWPARLLADKSRRKQFATDVVHDLELLLNPHRSQYSPWKKLKGDPVSRVDKGMIEGCRAITFQLHMKYQPTRWTKGIEDRDKILREAIGVPKSHGRWHF